MTKYINTSGHGGPEWVLSGYGITERIKEILGESDSIEVYGVSASHSNIPVTVSVSSSRGVDTLTFKELDAKVVENHIREHFGLNNSTIEAKNSDEKISESPNVEFVPEKDDVEFIPSPSFDKKIPEETEKIASISKKPNTESKKGK